LSNWVAACDLMLGMDVDVIVAGHGPITDKGGVAFVRDYLAFVEGAACELQASGVDAWEATREIAAQIKARPDFGTLGEFGRIAVNVDTVYRHLDTAYSSPNVVEQFRRMALLEREGPLSAH
jgi:cyclase